jgi:hypothetical protein
MFGSGAFVAFIAPQDRLCYHPNDRPWENSACGTALNYTDSTPQNKSKPAERDLKFFAPERTSLSNNGMKA